ncbi:MAG: calcium-binding protein [Clostridium sp.]
MKIVIDDQYHSDENKQYTVDENGNIDLFINIGENIASSTLEDSNNINCNENQNVIGSDFTELKENDSKIGENENEESLKAGVVIDNLEDPALSSTLGSDNPWEDEEFSKKYNNIYVEIENNLEKKYANENQRVESENFNSKDMYNVYEENKVREKKGSITVFSKLGSKDGVEIKGARINLYLLNGVSPKLYDSKFSDESGKVEFINLSNGCYRIIAIVDRRFFEKPIYYNWNEVTIDTNNNMANVLVVNRIKPGYYKR